MRPPNRYTIKSIMCQLFIFYIVYVLDFPTGNGNFKSKSEKR